MEIVNVNPNVRLRECCECLELTEFAGNVQYCKNCGAMFCKDCLDSPYTGPELNRSNWDCCFCAGFTEENGFQGQGAEYCRFCGEELCEHCGLFQVHFVDGEFSTSYTPGKKKIPDHQTPPRVSRPQRQHAQSSPAEFGAAQGYLGSERTYNTEQDGDEAMKPGNEEEVADGKTTLGSSEGDSEEPEELSVISRLNDLTAALPCLD